MAIYPRGAGRCRGQGSGIFQHQAHKLKDVKTDVLETGSKMVTTYSDRFKRDLLVTLHDSQFQIIQIYLTLDLGTIPQF